MGLAESVAQMTQRYPGKGFTDAQVATYINDLSVFPEPLACTVVDQLSKRGTGWPPTSGELCEETARRLLGHLGPSDAWGVMQTVEGRRIAPAAAKRALDVLGGPSALRFSERPMELRRAFIETYTEFAAAEVQRVAAGGPVELEQPPAHLRQIEGGADV